MFSTKLTLFAAAAALAVASVSAAEPSAVHLKITFHGNDGSVQEPPKSDVCMKNFTYVSVEGTGQWFCTEGKVCVAQNSDGNCPVPQCGLDYGSYCDKIDTGVYGCKPYTKESADKAHAPYCTGEGETPMSVEGVEGFFCVKGQACVGETEGACPGEQDRLPFGSTCGRVKTGVLGCKPRDKPEEKPVDPQPPKKDACVDGYTYVSVEGTGKWFCAKNDVCVAETKGNCPTAQCDLEYGSYCDRIQTGVFGCKPHTKESAEKAHVPYCKGEGETPMSVEGVEGVFCVKGQACAGEIDGACPRKGDNGLGADAKCARVKTGVLGCVPGATPSLRFL